VRLRLETSTLPVGDETDFEMGNLQSELTVDLCVDVLVRPTRVRRASQGPQGHVVPLRGAARRQDLTVGYVLQCAVCSAGRVESLVLQGRIIIAVHRAFVSGCEL